MLSLLYFAEHFISNDLFLNHSEVKRAFIKGERKPIILNPQEGKKLQQNDFWLMQKKVFDEKKRISMIKGYQIFPFGSNKVFLHKKKFETIDRVFLHILALSTAKN